MIVRHYIRHPNAGDDKRTRQGGSKIIVAFPRPDLKKVKEIREWCYATYGEPGYRSNTDETRWIDDITYGEVVLSRETDLTMFLLRWE